MLYVQQQCWRNLLEGNTTGSFLETATGDFEAVTPMPRTPRQQPERYFPTPMLYWS